MRKESREIHSKSGSQRSFLIPSTLVSGSDDALNFALVKLSLMDGTHVLRVIKGGAKNRTHDPGSNHCLSRRKDTRGKEAKSGWCWCSRSKSSWGYDKINHHNWPSIKNISPEGGRGAKRCVFSGAVYDHKVFPAILSGFRRFCRKPNGHTDGRIACRDAVTHLKRTIFTPAKRVLTWLRGLRVLKRWKRRDRKTKPNKTGKLM